VRLELCPVFRPPCPRTSTVPYNCREEDSHTSLNCHNTFTEEGVFVAFLFYSRTAKVFLAVPPSLPPRSPHLGALCPFRPIPTTSTSVEGSSHEDSIFFYLRYRRGRRSCLPTRGRLLGLCLGARLRERLHTTSGGAVEMRAEAASASVSVMCNLRGVVWYQQ